MLRLAFAGLLLAATPARPLLVTVDDLPIASGLHADPAERRRITQGLLAALAKHRVPAVGLVTWSHVRDAGDRALLDLWLAAGHELGNHSDRHLSLTSTDADAWLADVERARVEIDAFLRARGRMLRFFRFPFLREGDTEAKVDAARAWLARTGQRNLTVTIDDQDWSFEPPWVKAAREGDGAASAAVSEDYLASLRLSVRHHEQIGDALLGRLTPQILLLHANAVGAGNWDQLFTWLEQAGHRFATADEVLADPVFADLPRLPATHGFSLWDRLGTVRRDQEAREGVRHLLAAQAEAWSRGDIEAFCSVYAEDSLGDAVPSRVHSVSVVARWTLRRAGQADTSGLTLIVLRPRRDGWEIVQDVSM